MINFFEIIYWLFVVGCLSCLIIGVFMLLGIYDMVIWGFDMFLIQICINERGFEYRYYGCFFMIRFCIRSVFVLIVVVKVGVKMLVDWKVYVVKVIKM